jgi:glycogen synthase
MRVCLLTLEWPPYGGGIGTYMRNLARGLSDLGHDVTVLTHDRAPEQLDGVRIVEVPLPGEQGKLQRKILRWRWEPHHTWSLRAWRSFGSLETANSFDIMETAEYGSWARHFIGHVHMPLVVRCHTPAHGVRQIPQNGDGAARMPLWLSLEDKRERWQTSRADAIGSPSYVLANHISLSWSIPSNRITVLPNPVDTGLFHPNGGWADRRKELLYVGRLQYNKGVFDLIEAVQPLLREHPDMTVRLIGNDVTVPRHMGGSGRMASEEILARVPSELRRQVIIAGRASLPELISSQQRAMCAVVPSRGFESFSYTMTEHMACGTAVVVSHCGGPTEIISHGVDGILVPPGDLGALTSALRQLTENPGMCVELGQKARKKVEEQFSISVVAPRIARWYEQIIEDYKSKRAI